MKKSFISFLAKSFNAQSSLRIINCLVVRENAYFELIGLLECNGLAKVYSATCTSIASYSVIVKERHSIKYSVRRHLSPSQIFSFRVVAIVP